MGSVRMIKYTFSWIRGDGRSEGFQKGLGRLVNCRDLKERCDLLIWRHCSSDRGSLGS